MPDKYETPPNTNKSSGPQDREVTEGDSRERNTGHSSGEEHSRTEKGQQSRGDSGRR